MAEVLEGADWTATDKAIAKEFGVSVDDVATERRWRGVDWSMNSAAIGSTMGCSRQAAEKQRQARGQRAPDGAVVELEVPAALALIREVIGWRVSMHRLRLDITQSELAARLKTAGGGLWTPSGIWAVEAGVSGTSAPRTINIKTLSAFAAALGVSPADLVLRPKARRFSRLLHGPIQLPHDRTELRSVAGRNISAWRGSMSPGDLARTLKPRDGRWTATDIDNVESGCRRNGLRTLMVDTLTDFSNALGVTEADLLRLPTQPPLWVGESWASLRQKRAL